MVHRLGYRFRLHRRDLPGAPDLVLPRHKAVIFVNGCFWHWHPEPQCPIAGMPKSNIGYWEPKLTRTRLRDEESITYLEAVGWQVLVVWECQLRSPIDVLEMIRGFLEHRSREDLPSVVPRPWSVQAMDPTQVLRGDKSDRGRLVTYVMSLPIPDPLKTITRIALTRRPGTDDC